jgi:hypothetical protein
MTYYEIAVGDSATVTGPHIDMLDPRSSAEWHAYDAKGEMTTHDNPTEALDHAAKCSARCIACGAPAVCALVLVDEFPESADPFCAACHDAAISDGTHEDFEQ